METLNNGDNNETMSENRKMRIASLQGRDIERGVGSLRKTESGVLF